MRAPPQEVEVAQVEPELPAGQIFDERAHLVDVARLAVRRQPHHLVLGVVHVEAEIRRDGAVKQAERMGKADLLEQLERGARAAPVRRRRPLADGIDGQDRGVAPAREVIRRGGVREMMGDELDAAFPADQLADLALRPRRIQAEEKRGATGGTCGRPIQSCRSSFATGSSYQATQSTSAIVSPRWPGTSGTRAGAATGSCLTRVKRSSWAAASSRPSASTQQAES